MLDVSLGGYEMFRSRAMHPRSQSDEYWRSGFDPRFRRNQEQIIAAALVSILVNLRTSYKSISDSSATGAGKLLDIGSVASTLAERIQLESAERGIAYSCVDNPEVLVTCPRFMCHNGC
jgi:hypothetical protein